MAAPRETIWPAEPHTLAKHAILKGYLQAWFPILAKTHPRLIYYDGFAGPGRYSKGEDGSPVIALKVARDHAAPLNTELVFVFVEEDKDRAEWLETHEIPELNLPPKFRCLVRNQQFELALRTTLDTLDEKRLELAPTFAFIDPFGITGLPFPLIKRLLTRPHCEVFITFMNTTIQRFVTELPEQVNTLIGNPRAAELISAANNRVLEARRLYEASLREAARFVRFFELQDKNNTPIYDLFFASNNAQGHAKMKDAMWKVNTNGDYRFSDGLDPSQATLFGSNPENAYAPLLHARYQGREVLSDDVMRHTLDETPYLEKHAKAALVRLEDGLVPGREIEVAPLKQSGDKRRRRSFPDGVRLRFLT